MLNTGALSDVTLSANGTSVKAHRLILASCSQYFAHLFKEVETENNTLVVVLGCEPTELNLLLTFMYTGEVTTSKGNLPSLLRLAQTLKVSGLTDCDSNSTVTSNETEIVPEQGYTYTNIDAVKQVETEAAHNSSDINHNNNFDNASQNSVKETECIGDYRSEKDRLSKLDQIVQNLYSTHKISNPMNTAFTPPLMSSLEPYERKWRSLPGGSVCGVCNKRLSNQYNLRVHMETHAGRRHACRACSHVSRSRDALRKHVAYRHAGTRHADTRHVDTRHASTPQARAAATRRLDG